MLSAHKSLVHLLRRGGTCVAMTMFAWLLCSAAALADIGVAVITSVSPSEAKVTLSHSGYTPYAYTDGDSAGYKYRVCWRNTNQLTIACNTHLLNSNSQTFLIQDLNEGQSIEVHVWCYCRQDAFPHIKMNRIIADTSFTHHAPPPAPGLVSSSTVRLRSVQTNKCVYLENYPARARFWTCWPDPNMRFALQTYNDGHKFLRHLNTGNCLYGGRPIGSGNWGDSNAGSYQCGSLGTSVDIVDQGGGNVWISIPFTRSYSGPGWMNIGPGGCVFLSGTDGDDARKRTCQSDPALLFHLDPA